MRIAETYSHLNGLEFLLVHNKGLWNEIKEVVKSVDAAVCKTKVSREKTMMGQLLFSPKDNEQSIFRQTACQAVEGKSSSVLGDQRREVNSKDTI